MINGSKMWITNGAQADWICLLANTSDGHVHRNKSLICVPMNSKGDDLLFVLFAKYVLRVTLTNSKSF